MARFLKQSFAQTCLKETDNGKLQQFNFSRSLITDRGTVERGIKVPKELTQGRLQGITVDTESLMLAGIILFFLAQPKSQERACFLNVLFAPDRKLHFRLAF